jgi:hypothetical protein
MAGNQARKGIVSTHLVRRGHVIVGGIVWPEFEVYRCQICADTGVILGDHDEVLAYCDCEIGEAQR